MSDENATVAELVARIERVEQRCEDLRTEIAELEAEVEKYEEVSE